MIPLELTGGKEAEMSQVVVYGADWCKDTKHTRTFLNKLKVAHDFVNIEEDEDAREWVKKQNGGRERKPTVKIDDEVLAVPDDKELADRLKAHGNL